MAIPLELLCVAAAFVDPASGFIQERNQRFRDLVRTRPPATPATASSAAADDGNVNHDNNEHDTRSKGGGSSQHKDELSRQESIATIATTSSSVGTADHDATATPTPMATAEDGTAETPANDALDVAPEAAQAPGGASDASANPLNDTAIASMSIYEIFGLSLDFREGMIQKQIYQGEKEPDKWVRLHITKLSESSNLLQMEDIDELVRSKGQWTAVVETSYDGFWDYHITKNYEYMSPRFWEMFGYEAREKKHDPSEWMGMIHPEDLKVATVCMQKHFDTHGESDYNLEVRYRHKKGHWVWVMCRGRVIEWCPSTGSPLRMIGTHTDITETKLKQIQERELHAAIEEEHRRVVAANEELRKFVQHVNAPVFGVDKNMQIDTWNDRMERITGIPKQQVLQHAIRDVPSVCRASDLVEEALDGKEQNNVLLTVQLGLNQSPLKLLVNTNIRRNITDGSILGCFCFGLDLTEIQVANERLVRERERFAAEQTVNDFVAHEIRNPLAAALTATQFLREELAQSSMSETTRHRLQSDARIVSHSLDYIHQMLTSMLDMNKLLEGKITLRPRRVRLRKDIVASIQSIFERRRTGGGRSGFDPTLSFLEVSPVEDRDILESRNNSIEFENLEENDGDADADDDAVEDGKTERFDSNENDDADADDDVDKSHLIKFLVDCPLELQLELDDLRLKQAIANVLSNAFQFTQDGFIRLRVSLELPKPFEDADDESGHSRMDVSPKPPAAKSKSHAASSSLTLSSPTSEQDSIDRAVLIIHVEDSGPGIAPNKRSLLFQRYVPLAQQGQGSGIGLCLTRHLMESMGGTITVDDTYNSRRDGCPGTRFMMRLPLRRAGPDLFSAINSAMTAPVGDPSQTSSRFRSADAAVAEAAAAVVADDTTATPGVENERLAVKRSKSSEDPCLTSTHASLDGAPVKMARLSLNMDDGKSGTLPQSNRGSPSVSSSTATAHAPSNPSSEGVDNSSTAPASVAALSATSSYRNTENDKKPTAAAAKLSGADDARKAIPPKLAVLIVDDDKLIRKLLSRRLRNIDRSMCIDQAESGEIAIEKILNDHKKYDLILMDHYMPLCGGELTGAEVIARLRPHVPGIIIGSSGNDMSVEHRAAGADWFWQKPVPKDELLVKDLKQIFEMKGMLSS